MEQAKIALWQRFCNNYMSDNLGIPLFKTNNNIVSIKEYGKDNRLILERSEEMDNFIIDEVEKVINDFENETNIYEGLIYMMYKQKDDLVVPLYIGKSEKFGKSNNLSANIKGIEKGKKDRGKFSRWGDNYAYHIGDLSAVVCPNHPQDKMTRKYQKWASSLFESYPTMQPVLKEDVYFWICAWKTGNMGVFADFGYTPLTALEYQLISVAGTLFPDELLNQEGINRGQKYIWFILFHLYSATLSKYLLGV